MTDETSHDSPPTTTTPTKLDAARDMVAVAVGVAILVAFGVFIVYMLRNLGIPDNEWTRAMFLFGGVEAVAFSAAGYFFGTQVQRGRVQEAKSEAEAATKVAQRADEAVESERTSTAMLVEGILNAAPTGVGGLASDSDMAPDPRMETLVAQAQAWKRQQRNRR